MERVAGLLSTSTHDDLRRTVASPNGGTTSVMSCIHVVLGEEWAHNQYANRDLDAIAGVSPPGHCWFTLTTTRPRGLDVRPARRGQHLKDLPRVDEAVRRVTTDGDVSWFRRHDEYEASHR
jgi:hypothetical protein